MSPSATSVAFSFSANLKSYCTWATHTHTHTHRGRGTHRARFSCTGCLGSFAAGRGPRSSCGSVRSGTAASSSSVNLQTPTTKSSITHQSRKPVKSLGRPAPANQNGILESRMCMNKTVKRTSRSPNPLISKAFEQVCKQGCIVAKASGGDTLLQLVLRSAWFYRGSQEACSGMLFSCHPSPPLPNAFSQTMDKLLVWNLPESDKPIKAGKMFEQISMDVL